MAQFTSYCNAGNKKNRYGVRLTVTQNSQNIVNNTSNVTITFELGGAGVLGLATDYTGSQFYGYSCTGTIYVGGVQKSTGTSKPTITNSTKVTLTSWTGDLPHNADGTLTINCTGTFTGGTSNQASGGTAGGNVTFTTIPRSSSVAVTSSNIGSNPTITITRASNNFTHTLRYYFTNDIQGTIVSQTSATSYTSWTLPTTLYAKIPSSNSITGTLYCDTYNGSTLIGTSQTSITANVPSNANPTVSVPTLSDTISKPSGLSGYVKGKSKLIFNMTNCFSSSYSASFGYFVITLNGTQIYSGNATSYTMTTPLTETTNSYTLTAYDARGKYATTSTQTITAVDYSNTSITKLEANRLASPTTTVQVKFSGAISPLSNTNTKNFKIEYKLTSASSWTTATTLTSAYSYTDQTYNITGLSDSSTYNIRVVAQDFYTSNELQTSIGTTFTLINFNADGTSLAFGKASEYNDTFEVNMDTNITGDLSISGKLNNSTILYDNSTGENGNITLSDSIANYDYIEIYYTDNNKNFNECKKITTDRTGNILLNFVTNYISGNDVYSYMYVRIVSISGTALTNVRTTYLQIQNTTINTHNTNNYVYITKILGYK